MKNKLSLFQRTKSTWQAMTLTGKIALVIFFLFIIIAIFAEQLAIHSYRLPSGAPLQAPNPGHWLGTDDLGIDLWAQISYGARISMIIGVSTALIAGFFGSIVGMLAAYYGGWLDKVLMRIIDVLLALPSLPLVILFSVLLGPSVTTIIIVLAIISWVMPARIVRSRVLAIKEETFVTAARSYGAGFVHIARFHLLPLTASIISVSVIKLFSRAIVMESALSFLGLGDPTSKSWGIIIHHALQFPGIYMTNFWQWWVMAPLTALLLVVVSVALLCKELERIFVSLEKRC